MGVVFDHCGGEIRARRSSSAGRFRFSIQCDCAIKMTTSRFKQGPRSRLSETSVPKLPSVSSGQAECSPDWAAVSVATYVLTIVVVTDIVSECRGSVKPDR